MAKNIKIYVNDTFCINRRRPDKKYQELKEIWKTQLKKVEKIKSWGITGTNLKQ